MPVQTSIALTINAPIARVFEIAAGMDPRALIRNHGLLPGIIETLGHDAPWSAVGQKRRHVLSDKSSISEMLTAFNLNTTFAYDLTDFTGVFAALVRDARAEWHFTKLGQAKTQIDWTYFFQSTNAIAEPLLWFIVKLLWPGYLRAALVRVKEKAELDSHENREL